jgi:hypothetical protein
VRVKLTARVVQVTDPQNQLNGKIVVGQRVNGTYVYNTNMPNQAPFPGAGEYQPYANEARMRFAVGGLVFESAQPTQGIHISVFPHTQGSGQFIMGSTDNKPLSNGATVDMIYMNFQGVGTLTQSVALPSVAPDLIGYGTKSVSLSGSGFAYDVETEIEAAELIGAGSIEFSPAAGSFIPSQHFDAALTLPANSNVASAEASVNGVSVGLNYPGNCQLLPPNSAGKPSLLCPNADYALTLSGGAPIEWNVVLTNGVTLTESIGWVLAP